MKTNGLLEHHCSKTYASRRFRIKIWARHLKNPAFDAAQMVQTTRDPEGPKGPKEGPSSK